MGKKTKSKNGTTKEATLLPPAPPIMASSSAQQAVNSSSKRQRGSDDASAVKKPSTTASTAGESGGGGNEDGDGSEADLVFEDPFGDEFEQEDIDNRDKGAEEDGGEMKSGGAAGMDVEEEPRQQEVQTKVWRAGVDELTEGQELEYDSTAYHMYHSLRPEWPCLSFDVIRDSLGTNRSRFPHTVFAVAGTQADAAESNRLQVMKLSDLHRTRKTSPGSDGEESEDDEEEGPDETDDDPILDHINIPHRGGVNRVRSMPQQPHIVATWSETSDVHVWDLERQLSALAKGAPRSSKVDPVFTFEGHPEVRQ